MKAVILAAGYATRLYPLTRNFPKPLLAVGGQTILDRLVNQIERALPGTSIWVVTNARFVGHFFDWARRHDDSDIRVLDDGTTGPENRLGAIGDLAFALERAGGTDNCLVAAADNLFEFDLAEFAAAFQRRPAVWICVHRVEDSARRRRTGIAELGPDDCVIGFEEKPAQPRSQWGVPPLYFLTAEAVGRVREYLASGRSTDSPGHFIAWLHTRVPVFAWRVRGMVHDIGTLESLAECRARFSAQTEKESGAAERQPREGET